VSPAREQAVANAVTLARVPLAIAVALTLDRPAWALALAAAAALSDAADGRIARHAKARGSTSTAGDWLDPVADKVFVAIAATALAVHLGAWLVLALVAARELAMVALAPLAWRHRAHLPRRASTLGKVTTDAQFATIVALIVYAPAALPLAVATAALGLAATIGYARRAIS
jgi:cardiolipin synthase